ncbi:hypothetical protein [Massilibacterium senegalense]|uniref:hypothetical protein n=1 Tax=Massilibacterium senegalense TaxID=1632858 RepID=UPI00164CE258|nr:hypothetical protein [Massilibacterium senegalense]
MPERDSLYEGRDKVAIDVDRMINEGLAGGRVNVNEEYAQIEDARPLTEEEPPRRVE